MKSVQFFEWNDLTEKEKKEALRTQCEKELAWLVQTGGDFVSGEELDVLTKRAIQEAEEMQTPWFASSYLWDVKEVREYIEFESENTLSRTLFQKVGTVAVPYFEFMTDEEG